MLLLLLHILTGKIGGPAVVRRKTVQLCSTKITERVHRQPVWQSLGMLLRAAWGCAVWLPDAPPSVGHGMAGVAGVHQEPPPPPPPNPLPPPNEEPNPPCPLLW